MSSTLLGPAEFVDEYEVSVVVGDARVAVTVAAVEQVLPVVATVERQGPPGAVEVYEQPDQPASTNEGAVWIDTGTLLLPGEGPPGPPGPPGPAGATPTFGWWNYHQATAPPPAAGQVRTAPEPPAVGEPYTIWLSGQDRDGLDWFTGAAGAEPGDEIWLRGTGGAFQHCRVTAVAAAAGYAVIDTILEAATGAIAKNADVRIDLFGQPRESALEARVAALEARLAALEGA